MKRTIATRLLMLLAMLFGAWSAASATDRFFVDAVNIEPGETIQIAFNLENSQEFFGFQADINLPDGLEIVQTNGKPDCTLSSRANSSYAMVCNQLSANTVRVGAFSTNHTAISGNSGALLYVNVHASDSFGGGILEINNILFTNAANNDVELPNYTIELGTKHNDRFYIPDFKIAVGETKEVSIILDNETAFSAFQTDIYLPEGLTIVADSPKMTSRGSGHTLSAKAFSDGRVRLACLSMNSSVFTGNSGALVTLQISANKDVAETCKIELKNQIFSMASAKEYVLPNSTTNVTTERALVESISLNYSSIALTTGESMLLTAEILPAYASTKDIEWSSSNPEIATVDNTGLVSAIAPGNAVITAKAVDGSNITASCGVTVSGIPVTGITLNRTSGQLKVTETLQLSATIQPANAYDKSLTWESSDETIATVNESGVVTAVKEGDVSISAISVSNPEIKASCSITVIPTPVSSIELNLTELSLEVGQSSKLEATVLPQTATNKEISWRSSDETIATVDNLGNITAIALGTARVYAESTDGSNITASCSVNVIPTATTGITIVAPSQTSFKVGETISLVAKVEPENATDKTVVWSASDSSVATVDAKGLVTARGVGEVTITATNSAGMTADITLTVVPTLAESVTISPTTASLRVGEAIDLRVSVLPETTTDKSLAWTTSNDDVASVDEHGHVEALSIGSTIVTATAADGSDVYGSAEITVVPTPATGISIVQPEKTSFYVGESFKLSAIVTPEDATNKSVTWQTQNAEIFTVDDEGIVKAVGLGEAWISATNSAGQSDYLTLTVIPTPVTSITLNTASTELKVGETFTISATVAPADATDRSISFSSSKPSVAEVDADGKVTAIGLGETIITVSANDGSGVTATFTVTIVPTPVESISILANGSTTLKAGQTVQLEAVILPETATDKSTNWTSDNDNIATVDAAGLVTAHSVGTTTITASAGGQTAHIQITVEKTLAESISLNRTSAILKVGGEMQLSAIVSPETTTDKSIEWSTSNPSIVTVDGNGKVVAVNLGQCDVTAKTTDASNLSTVCHITVEETSAESVAIAPHGPFTLKIGETVQLSATVLPETTSDKSVAWQSQTASVVVDESGLVTAISPVENNWVMATNSAGQTDIVYVTVLPTLVLSIEPSQTVITLKVGETAQLSAQVKPDDATDKRIRWESENSDIASVMSDGLVTACSIGEVRLRVFALDGSNVDAYVTVKVVPTPTDGITILQPETTTFRVGEKINLSAVVTPADATDKSVTWSSSDESKAIVDANGKVTAVGIGDVVITATASGGQTAGITLTVERTFAQSLVLNQTSAELKVGNKLQLVATIAPSTTTDKSLSWSSSNPEVVNVDNNGLVEVVALGEAVITAKTADGSNLSATCSITVVPTPVESVKIIYDGPTSLKIGQTAQLNVEITPEDATDKSIKWLSMSSGMTVTQTGLVTAVAEIEGNWICAEASNGVADYLNFNVIPNPVESIELSAENTSIKVGDKTQISAVVMPDNATNKTLTWDSNNNSIAIVDQNGIVTGISVGEVDINARATDGSGVTQSIKINVIATPVESVTLSTNGSTTLKDGESVTITASVAPVTATNSVLIWTSDNEAIATVNNGIVTAHAKLGDAHIKATAHNGVSAEVVVTVVETPVETVEIHYSGTTTEILDGEQLYLYATVYPSTATNQYTNWSVSDESIISVTADGIVSALKPGEAYVYAESVNGIRGTLLIVVKPILIESITIPTNLQLDCGTIFDFHPEIKPENASIKQLRWVSSDETVGMMWNEAYNQFRGYGVGHTTLTCYATDGSNVSATCEIDVIKKVKSVTLNEHDITLNEGQSFQLIATVEPIDATNVLLNWYSSDPEVASVDENGLVEAISEGETVISVLSVLDASFCSDECRVKVKMDTGITSVTFDDVKIETQKGRVIVKQLELNSSAKLFDLNGNLIQQKMSNGNDIVFDVSSNQIYIVSIGKFALKVMVP